MKRIAVIGGGPGGMAAAVAAKACGVPEVVLFERQPYLGGVLPQCIHTGFGIELYEKDFTGGEYAHFWSEKTWESGVSIRKETAVLGLFPGKKWTLDVMDKRRGREKISADGVIVATGCRERTLPQMLIPGSRPAGVFTAGTAQYMMNIKNMLPGRSAVIFGSGDIGLIMARRMHLEGMKVPMVLGMKGTGLTRNVTQCVRDFGIPLRYGWTLTSTHGYSRLKGVTVAPFKEDGSKDIDISRKEYIPCDTLLVATGLIPELEVCKEHLGKPGLYLCGNASRVHDLVDHVTAEGVDVGVGAAEYVLGPLASPEELKEIRGFRGFDRKEDTWGNMVCTVCPKGCVLQVGENPFSVGGNQCERGIAFARQELLEPKRMVTSVVAIRQSQRLMSVKTDKQIPKEDIPKVMAAIKRSVAPASARHGDVIVQKIGGTDADIVATGEGIE
ncbi:MAG: DUF1667 domain-containing protein [Anaerovoracaceae bacterium]|jgi:CxxC motif-containing protein/thioredoxin reductase